MMRWIFAVLALFAVASCARVAEDRVETALVEAGLPGETAACMAERMTERLSIDQLRKLERLKAREGEADIPVSLPEYLERVRRVDDPEVIEVTASSAAVCTFSGL